jgi:hypothetical protein
MKFNLVIAVMLAALVFPVGVQSDPGKTVTRQMTKQIERVREVKVSDEECKIERLVSEEPSKPVRKLIGKLRLRKK